MDAISEAYSEFDSGRRMLERALDLSSQELFQSNSELRGVLQSLPDLLFRVGADGRVMDVMQAVSLAGHRSLRVLVRESAAGPPVGAARQFWQAVQQVRETQAATSFEYTDCSDGSGLFFEARLLPFVGRDIIGIVRDITVRRQAENALRASEEAAKRAQAELMLAKLELEAEREKLQQLATRDSLTGVWNRRAIFELLSKELARAERQGRPVTVIMADLDNFKTINDCYGHPVGDRVLQETARLFRSGVRGSDEIGRYGGEEFLLVLPGCAGEAAHARVERLRCAVEKTPIPLAHEALNITCSLGMSWARAGVYDGDRLVREADDALYRAKRSGRNRVEAAVTDCPLATAPPRNRG